MRAILASLLCLTLQAQTPARKPPSDGVLLAASEGHGQVRLLIWPPLKSPIPAGGWQIQDATGKVLVPLLKAGEPDALKALPPEEALETVKVQSELQSETDPGKRRLLALNALLSAGNRPELGRALGLACALADQPLGRRSFVAVGLDSSGKIVGPRLTSAEVDPGLPSPLPEAPDGLRAAASKEAVQLFWQPVPSGDIPIIDYRVQRGDLVLTPTPNVMGYWDTGKPAFEDHEAPGDQSSEYRVWAVDVFGRRGPDRTVGVFFPDPRTLRPPADVKAQALEGQNQLNFRPSPTRRSAGILVERALTPSGPFELLTTQPLSPTATSFTDGAVGGGATYYYRLRVSDADGNVGDPGPTVYAIARSKGRPAPPAGLAVVESPAGHLLTWQPSETLLAGYLVERRRGDGEWARLDSQLVKGTRFEDVLTQEASGRFSYRLMAITLDNLQSDPCAPVTLERANLLPPEAPVFLGVDGAGGQVRLSFRPAAPEERTASLLVLRSIRKSREEGEQAFGIELVVGDPLPGNTRSFTDAWVDPGETYRYRLVALSPEGVRSAMAQGVEVRVSPPPVPEPPAPALKLVDQPFRCIQVSLPPVPEGFRAFLHRKAPGEKVWSEIQGPFREQEVVDPRPVSGRVQYRIHFEDDHGLVGRSGPAVEVVIP